MKSFSKDALEHFIEFEGVLLDKVQEQPEQACEYRYKALIAELLAASLFTLNLLLKFLAFLSGVLIAFLF